MELDGPKTAGNDAVQHHGRATSLVSPALKTNRVAFRMIRHLQEVAAMPQSEQLKALVQSHRDGDDEHFYSVALQLAALEARKGNIKLAEEIKRLVDSSR